MSLASLCGWCWWFRVKILSFTVVPILDHCQNPSRSLYAELTLLSLLVCLLTKVAMPDQQTYKQLILDIKIKKQKKKITSVRLFYLFYTPLPITNKFICIFSNNVFLSFIALSDTDFYCPYFCDKFKQCYGILFLAVQKVGPTWALVWLNIQRIFWIYKETKTLTWFPRFHFNLICFIHNRINGCDCCGTPRLNEMTFVIFRAHLRQMTWNVTLWQMTHIT
jgi:hypothetical protein